MNLSKSKSIKAIFSLFFFFISFLGGQLRASDNPLLEDQSLTAGIDQQILSLQQRVEDLENKDKKEKYFQAHYQNVTAKFGGKYTEEAFVSRYLTLLNNKIPNDSSFFIRTTSDYWLDLVVGDHKKPRIMVHETFRFRYKWGSGTEVRVLNGRVIIDLSNINFNGTAVNKHLLWSREAWIKIALGDTANPHDHFIQLGLFPYQVGRGISFGPAFQQAGFLGFTPGFSIDQFAPGGLLHLNPIPEKLSFDLYVALLNNPHISFKSNSEIIRKNELNACPDRGTERYSYAAILRALWEVICEKNRKLLVEPYVLYFQAADQRLEFNNDADSTITTYGLALEGRKDRWNWGFETGINTGQAQIKPWDRNQISIASNDDGQLIQQYSKVVTEDPLDTTSPTKAVLTEANKIAVANASKNPDLNGQQIGKVGDVVKRDENDSSNNIILENDLYNTFDRFRPDQRRLFGGYFFIADGTYEVIESVLNLTMGAGYASGDLNDQFNANNRTKEELLNQRFDGFIPLQSVYSGTRLRHLIVFNQGIPRFNVSNPNGKFTNVNTTPAASVDSLEFTNISFFGGRVGYTPRAFKKDKVLLASNIIAYWVPETPIATNQKTNARNYLGTEMTTEVSALLFQKLKLYGYGGVLFPGSYFKDMKGTKISGKETSHDIAFIINLGASYAF